MTEQKGVLGLIVGGGPAPGINGVISAATIEAHNHGIPVLGIRRGFKSLFEGDRSCALPLSLDDVSRIHTRGGSVIRTSRDYPERAKEQFPVLISTIRELGIRYLITIGGEGTLFMANWIESESRGDFRVVHVPKTIDNDIPLPGGVSTFGYETARHWGVQIVQNIMEDARTTGRWYFITTMGKHTGHLALGIGKAAGATVTVIPEEFGGEGTVSLRRVADILAGSIIKRLSQGKDHGVAVLAEGIAERLDMEELKSYEHLEKDETGRIRLPEIQLGRVLKTFVQQSLEAMGIGVTIVDKNIGYELRAADPIPFDVEYTRNLGYGAVRYLLRGGTGDMIIVSEGRIRPVPFVELMDETTGRVMMRRVDLPSENYVVGREYMIRLEKEDLEGESLDRLARTTSLSPVAFRERFSSLFL